MQPQNSQPWRPKPQGMTLKQYACFRFWKLCEVFQEAKKRTDTEEGKRAFVLIAVQLHAAKGTVPKSYGKYAR